MIHHTLVFFYRIWHGVFHFKGAGALLTRAAATLDKLQHYPLKLAEGHTIEVDFRDVSSMYWLNFLLGDPFEEKGLLAAIKPFLKGRDVIWDIGANSGLLSYHLARRENAGEMHLFEPNPRMSKLAAMALSAFPHAKVHDYGISDRNAEFTLTIPEGHTTMGTLEPDATGRKGMKCKVTCRLGDELVFKQGFNPPQVIKIDTEGHEHAVITGLSKIIETYRPVVFFEHISLDREGVKSLVPSNYSLFTVSDTTGELVPDLDSHAGHNSVLVPNALAEDDVPNAYGETCDS